MKADNIRAGLHPDRRRALVVDDDPIMRSLSRSRLARIVDEVVEASDGLAAWRLLTMERFDLAIVDLMMPNLNGFALIQCMRGHPRTRHMPIVVVSSNDDRGSIEKALQAGASAFITKPVTWTVFAAHVEHLMRLSSAAERAERQLVRQVAISEAQAQLVGAMAAHSHASLRRIEVRARGLADGSDTVAALLTETAVAQAQSARLRSGHRMIASFDLVNAHTHPWAGLADAALSQAAGHLHARGVSVVVADAADFALQASPDAITFAISASFRILADGIEAGTVLSLTPLVEGEALIIRLEVAGSGWGGVDAEDADADLAVAAQSPAPSAALDLALIRTVLAAHGGTLRTGVDGEPAAAIELRLPADRVWRLPVPDCAVLRAATA